MTRKMLDLLRERSSDIDAVRDFLAWMEREGLDIITRDGGVLCEAQEHIAWRWAGIDRKQLERERRALLEAMQRRT